MHPCGRAALDEGHGSLAVTPARMVLQEELRALRTAVQLMVKRTDDTARPSKPAMEVIQEGSREAEADSDPVAEEVAAGGAAGAAGAHSPSGVIDVANSAEVSAECLAAFTIAADVHCTGLIAMRMSSDDSN